MIKKPSRKSANTPRSQIRSALRKLWLRSRERQAALKRDGYTCVTCGAKQSRAKGREIFVEVDHLDGVRWDEMFDFIYQRLLVDPSKLQTQCHPCHMNVESKRKLGNDGQAEAQDNA